MPHLILDILHVLQNYQEVGVAIPTLQKVVLPITDFASCSNIFTGIDERLHLCAGAEVGKDTCSGDSGGPLVFRSLAASPWYQVGITSFGPKICGSGPPGIYTKVHHFIDWIRRNMRP